MKRREVAAWVLALALALAAVATVSTWLDAVTSWGSTVDLRRVGSE